MSFAYFFAHRLIFPAPEASYTEKHPGVFKLTLPNGKRIAVQHMENPNAEYTILFSHGNRQDLGRIQDRIEGYYALGWSVIAYDYPGYGVSDGRPTEAGCYAAIDAVYDYLVYERGVSPEKIVAYGFSLGGGPTIDLACRRPVGGVIAEGTFVSIFGVYTRYNILPWNRFNNIEKVKNIPQPILFIHGDKDRTVAFWNSKALFKEAPEPKSHLWIAGAGHCNLIETAGTAYIDALESFKDTLNQTYTQTQTPIPL